MPGTDLLEKNKKQQLRSKLRRARMNASKKYAFKANLNLTSQLRKLRVYRSAKNIGIYLPFQSEFPTASIIQSNLKLKKHSYVPSITSIRNKQMRFVPLHKKNANNYQQHKLKKNVYGISEPKNNCFKKSIKPQSLDIIFLPLLGFNQNGDRLGMGGGYYDRALQFKLAFKHLKRPYLIGLAFSAQKVPNLNTQKWDIPLNAVITEEDIFHFDSLL